MLDSHGKLTEVNISRNFKINAGNFESMDSFASLKYTVSDATDMVELGERAQSDMDSLQAPDLFRILEFLVDAKNKTSLIHSLVSFTTSDE